MDRKTQVLETLIAAYDLMIEGLPIKEITQSGLFAAWLDQAGATLGAGGMELERQMWETIRRVPVSLDTPTAVHAYGAGMRAVLLGMLYYAEKQQDVR